VTKRALRTILKADEACVGSAEPSAQLLVDKNHTPNDDYTLLAMRDVVALLDGIVGIQAI
jgi:hypothetical protein